jgi:hypothetical protein
MARTQSLRDLPLEIVEEHIDNSESTLWHSIDGKTGEVVADTVIVLKGVIQQDDLMHCSQSLSMSSIEEFEQMMVYRFGAVPKSAMWEQDVMRRTIIVWWKLNRAEFELVRDRDTGVATVIRKGAPPSPVGSDGDTVQPVAKRPRKLWGV